MAFCLSVGRQLFIDKLAGSVFGPASAVFYDTLLSYLERGWKVLLWLGLILVVTGWFTGSNRSGTAVRSTVSGGLQTVGAALADGPVGGAGRWVAANARWLRVVIGVLGAVVLLWGNDISPSRLLWSLVLVVVLLAVVQVLVGAGGRNGASTRAPTGDAETTTDDPEEDRRDGGPRREALIHRRPTTDQDPVAVSEMTEMPVDSTAQDSRCPTGRSQARWAPDLRVEARRTSSATSSQSEVHPRSLSGSIS